jgi:hypothetical protein
LASFAPLLITLIVADIRVSAAKSHRPPAIAVSKTFIFLSPSSSSFQRSLCNSSLFKLLQRSLCHSSLLYVIPAQAGIHSSRVPVYWLFAIGSIGIYL